VGPRLARGAGGGGSVGFDGLGDGVEAVEEAAGFGPKLDVRAFQVERAAGPSDEAGPAASGASLGVVTAQIMPRWWGRRQIASCPAGRRQRNEQTLGQRSKRHHVVPRMYIERWADENGRVHVADLAQRKSYLASIGDVPVLNEFYTLEAEDGSKSDAFENVLSDVEGKAASVFQALEEGHWPLDRERREVMANFVALQIARLPSLRQVMDDGLTQIHRKMAAMTLASDTAFDQMIDGAFGPGTSDADRARTRAALEEDFEVRLTGAGFADAMLEVIGGVLQPIYDMKWTLVTAKESEFITSDKPVFHWRYPQWPENQPVGLFSAERTHLPVNRHQILVMRFEFDGDKLVPSAPDDEQLMLAPGVHIVNANVAIASDRKFFIHPDALSNPDFTFRPLA
jgi:hypothetical protein